MHSFYAAPAETVVFYCFWPTEQYNNIECSIINTLKGVMIKNVLVNTKQNNVWTLIESYNIL